MSDEPQRYEDPNLRHLLARAVVVEQRIRRAVEARQLTDPHPDDAFRGLYLTEETITRLLDEGRTFPVPDGAEASVPTSTLAPTGEPPSRLTSLARSSVCRPSMWRSCSSRSYRIWTTASRRSTATSTTM